MYPPIPSRLIPQFLTRPTYFKILTLTFIFWRTGRKVVTAAEGAFFPSPASSLIRPRRPPNSVLTLALAQHAGRTNQPPGQHPHFRRGIFYARALTPASQHLNGRRVRELEPGLHEPGCLRALRRPGSAAHTSRAASGASRLQPSSAVPRFAPG